MKSVQDVLCLAYYTWIREGYLAVLIFSSGRYRKAPFYSNSLFCHMLKQHIEQEKMWCDYFERPVKVLCPSGYFSSGHWYFYWLESSPTHIDLKLILSRTFCILSVAWGQEALLSSGNILEMQNFRSHPGPTQSFLHFIMIPPSCVYTLNFIVQIFLLIPPIHLSNERDDHWAYTTKHTLDYGDMS